MASLNGAFNMLKPPGMSSHDLVKFIRNSLKGTKVGHGGTLDPGSSGVLPILVGRSTKLAGFLLDYKKNYHGEVTLGKTTTTDDPEGDEIFTASVPPLDESKINKILEGFLGEKQQIPPLFSAIKHKGKKYLDYARKGIEPPVAPRTVYIYKCKLLYFWPPDRILLDITCSKGTYVRSLARDLGELIGCGAHLSFLVRKSTGPFHINEAVTIEEFAEAVQKDLLSKLLLPPDFCILHLRKMLLEEKDLDIFLCGTKIRLDPCNHKESAAAEEYYRVYNKSGQFMALAKTVRWGNYYFLQPVTILQSS